MTTEKETAIKEIWTRWQHIQILDIDVRNFHEWILEKGIALGRKEERQALKEQIIMWLHARQTRGVGTKDYEQGNIDCMQDLENELAQLFEGKVVE